MMTGVVQQVNRFTVPSGSRQQGSGLRRIERQAAEPTCLVVALDQGNGPLAEAALAIIEHSRVGWMHRASSFR